MRTFKKTSFNAFAALAASALGVGAVGFMTSGCYDEPTHTRTVYVEHHDTPPPVVRDRVVVVDPPPADRVEVIPESRSGYMWVRGHYVYDGHQYRWADGRYEAIPRPGARYIPGHWDRVDRGYVWTEGRWD
ncbi:MAG TPA: hypothetical protein VH518_21670 [Tepidisphaeraceae bacterium]|jgi:hypothetical protein